MCKFVLLSSTRKALKCVDQGYTIASISHPFNQKK